MAVCEMWRERERWRTVMVRGGNDREGDGEGVIKRDDGEGEGVIGRDG